jgi:hypothetical protein
MVDLLSSSPLGVNITSGHRSVSTMPTNHSSFRANSTSGHRSVSTMPTNYSSFGKQSEITKAVVDGKVTSAITLHPFIEF